MLIHKSLIVGIIRDHETLTGKAELEMADQKTATDMKLLTIEN